MADRYWVGGTGTWNSSNTVNWSTTSGGAGGASAPTSVDNVFFDANSGTGTVTCSGNSCLSYTSTGTTLTFSGTGTVYKDVILGSTGTYTSFSITFSGVSVTQSITTNGKTISSITCGSSTVDLNDNLTTSSTININGGTFNTNNFNITCSSFNLTTYTNLRVVNLGSSTITVNGSTFAANTSTYLTLNAGTSTFIFTSSVFSSFTGESQSFYNVTFSSPTSTALAISGANTFNNFTVATPSGSVRPISFSADQTINGTIASTGSGYFKLYSATAGTQRTLYVGTTPSASKVMLADINFAGTASPWGAPLGVADYGNNTGITFDTTTLYWVAGTGNWSDPTHWSTTSGGAPANVIPGASNPVIFDANSGASSSCTASSDFCGNLTISSSPTTISGTVNVYGNLLISSYAGTSFSSLACVFRSTLGGNTIQTSGSRIGTCTFNAVGGSWTLLDALDLGGIRAINLYAGSFYSGGFSINASTIVTNFATAKALYLGASAVTLVGANPINLTGSNFTFDAGTSTITCTDSGSTTTWSSGLTFYNVTIAGPTSTGYKTLNIGADFTVLGTFTCSGSLGIRRIKLNSTVSGTIRTITAATVALTDVDFREITCAGTATWSGTRVGDAGLNTNLIPDAPKTVYWNLAAGGSMMTSTAWATSVGGTPDTLNFPLPQDTAVFVDTGLNAAATVSIGTSFLYTPSLDFSGRTAAMTFNWSANAYCCGNLTYSSAVTNSGSMGVSIFRSLTITGASGKPFVPSVTVYVGANFTINSPTSFSNSLTVNLGATMTLTGDVTTTSSILNNGTLNLAGYTLTTTSCSLGSSSTTAFSSSGRILLTGTGTVFNGNGTQTITGTPDVRLDAYTGASTRTVQCNSTTETNSVNVTVVGGVNGVFVNGNVKDFTVLSATINAAPSIVYGSFYLASAGTFTQALYLAGSSGVKTLYSEKTLVNSVTFAGAGSTWQLSQDFTVQNDMTTYLNAGTLDLNGFNFNTGVFSSPSPLVRQINFNGGAINLTAAFSYSVSVLGIGGTNFTYTGTPTFNMTGVTASTRLATSDCTELNAVDINVIAGTDQVSISGSVRNLNVQHSGYLKNDARTIYGNLTIGTPVSVSGGIAVTTFAATSGTKTITTNGKTLDFPITFNGVGGTWQLADNLTIGSTRNTTITNGTLDQNAKTITCWSLIIDSSATFATSGVITAAQRLENSGTLTLGANATFATCTLGAASTTNFSTYKISLTGNNTTIFTGNATQTVTGTPVFDCTYSGSTGTRTITSDVPTEANSISFNITAGTDTVSGGGAVRNLDFTGFAGTWSNAVRTVYGNVVFSTGMTLTAGTSATTFAATSGTKTITTNGKTLDFPLTFNGVGGTWQLQDNLTVGATRTVTLTNGTLNTNSKTVTSGTFSSSNSNARTLTLGSTVWSVASTATVWDCATSTNMTLNAGTSEIILSSTSTTARTFAGGGLTYNKVTIGGATGTSTTTITGSNVFATLASTKVVAHTISITSSTTQTIGTWSINGTAGNVVTLGSTSTTNHTLVKSGGGTVTANYMSISRSTASPTLTWLATNSTNGGNNIDWYFGSFSKGNTLFFGSNF